MISINDAVKIAQRTLQDLVPQASNILLEEVELDVNNGEWLITLSFPDSSNGFSVMGSQRKYKLIMVDAEAGTFKAMKIRNA